MLREAQRLATPEVLPAVERALEALSGAPSRIVHGDSHPGNVLWTAGGPLGGDWEDAHLAPLEWDLACLVTAARVQRGGPEAVALRVRWLHEFRGDALPGHSGDQVRTPAVAFCGRLGVIYAP